MRCKKCNNEIKEGAEFCPNCGKRVNSTSSNKTKILIILGIIIFISIIVAAIIFFIQPQTNSNENNTNNTLEQDIADVQNSDIYYNNEYDVFFDDGEVSNYIAENMKMPDLTGMEYNEAKKYLEENGYYFITDIKCKYDEVHKDWIHIPTKIISTIPAAVSELNINTTSITALTEYNYGIQTVDLKLSHSNEDIVGKYFGKTIRVQFGSENNNIIEGKIGEDFTKINIGSQPTLRFSNYKKGTALDLVAQNKMAYITKTDLIDEDANGYLTNHFVNGKIYIDNQLVKEGKFLFNNGQIAEIDF